MQDMELGSAVEASKATSLLRAAQKKREEREAHLFLDIPSWDGALIGEYKIIEPKQMKKIAARVSSMLRANGNDPTIGDIELIVHSCVAIHVRDPESGERVPLEDEFGIVGYNRIGIVLGKEDEIKSTADAVRYLTAERDDETGEWTENVTAINRHAMRINAWMSDPSKRTVSLEDLLSDLA